MCCGQVLPLLQCQRACGGDDGDSGNDDGGVVVW